MTDFICSPDQNSDTSVTSTIRSQDGRYTLDNIDTLISDFQGVVVTIPENVSNLSRLIETYGAESVYASIKNLNTMLINPDVNSILVEYPVLTERLTTEIPITSIEYSEFVTEFLYTPATLDFEIVSNYSKIASELNEYFTYNFTSNSMSSFCSIAPSIFGAIDGFFDSLDNFKDILGKIKNLNVVNLLKQLKDKIINVVDKVIDKVKKAIENFSISSIIGRVEIIVNENIISKVTEIKEEALRFFSEENIKKLKSKIEGLINYAISIFKEPSLEEIQYLIYRFCNFIAQIETSINSIRNPLDSFANNYYNTYNTLNRISNINTANAIAAGAIRYNQEQRKSEYIRMRDAETLIGNPRPIESSEIDGVTSWNNGKGDTRIGFQGRWVSLVGEEGWTRVSPKVRVLLMRVQSKFGRKLIVNSGYRPPEYNRSIGGASRSLHMSGLALDITWIGINIENREEFIRIAREEGFGGIGRYGTRFVHVDVGPQRNWSG